jgi:hypothetical protein
VPKNDSMLKALEAETAALQRLAVSLCEEHEDDPKLLNLLVMISNHRASIVQKRKEPIIKSSLLEKDKQLLFDKTDTKLLKEERELQAALKQTTPTAPKPWSGKGKGQYQGKGYSYGGRSTWAPSKGAGHQRSPSASGGGRGYSGGRGKGKGASSRGKGGAAHTPAADA